MKAQDRAAWNKDSLEINTNWITNNWEIDQIDEYQAPLRKLIEEHQPNDKELEVLVVAPLLSIVGIINPELSFDGTPHTNMIKDWKEKGFIREFVLEIWLKHLEMAKKDVKNDASEVTEDDDDLVTFHNLADGLLLLVCMGDKMSPDLIDCDISKKQLNLIKAIFLYGLIDNLCIKSSKLDVDQEQASAYFAVKLMDLELFGFGTEDAPIVWNFIMTNREKWLTDILIFGANKLKDVQEGSRSNFIFGDFIRDQRDMVEAALPHLEDII